MVQPGSTGKGRRSPGEGSIYLHKDGLWVGALQIDGKRKKIYGKTKAEVARKLNELKVQAATLNALPSTIKFAKYADQWLQQRRPPVLEQKTWISYEQMLRLHIVPELGPLKLSDIRAPHVKELLRRILDKPVATLGVHRKLSPRTAQLARSIVHKMLQDACEDQLLSVNVADYARGPKQRKQPKYVWSPAELQRAIEAAAGTRREALWAFLIVTGCRINEALAITWDDIDFDERTVWIRKSLFHYKRQCIIKLPKTDSGIRQRRLAPVNVELLRVLRASQPEGQEVVFSTRSGTYLNDQNVRREFDKWCQQADVPVVGPHSLRHLAATYLLASGMPPRAVAEYLGHADPTLVMRTYGHVLAGATDGAADILGGFLNGGRKAAEAPPDPQSQMAESSPAIEVLPVARHAR